MASTWEQNALSFVSVGWKLFLYEMIVLIPNLASYEVPSHVICYLLAKENAPIQILNEIKTVYGDGIMNRTMCTSGIESLKQRERIFMMNGPKNHAPFLLGP